MFSVALDSIGACCSHIGTCFCSAIATHVFTECPRSFSGKGAPAFGRVERPCLCLGLCRNSPSMFSSVQPDLMSDSRKSSSGRKGLVNKCPSKACVGAFRFVFGTTERAPLQLTA